MPVRPEESPRQAQRQRRSRWRTSIPPNAARRWSSSRSSARPACSIRCITLRPLKGQIDETIELCRQRVERDERVLVTTLTKKTAEDLSEYLQGTGLEGAATSTPTSTPSSAWKSCASSAPRPFDVLVGINLLREGLDLPEVSLVCILDADKEGFLRNETSLIQTAGRAARHISGECVLFCDKVTDSIQALHRRHRIPPRPPAGTQRTTRHHPAEREARAAAEPPHPRKRTRACGQAQPLARRRRRRTPTTSCASSPNWKRKCARPRPGSNSSAPPICAIRSPR